MAKMRDRATGQIGPVYIRAVSKTGVSPHALASATASGLGSTTSRNSSPPPGRTGDETREHGFGAGPIVGDEGPDLVAAAAGADDAPGRQPAVADERASEVPRRADPGAQKRGARRGEYRGIVRCDRRERDVPEVDQALRRRRDGRHAAEADIAVGEDKAGFAVIVLLGHHAVEADRARTGMGNGRLPGAQPMTAPAQVGPHDVEAEEGEAVVIVHHRNGRSRGAAELADMEAVGIDGGKAGGVLQTGIPALRGRPVAGEGDVAAVHHANGQLVGRHVGRCSCAAIGGADSLCCGRFQFANRAGLKNHRRDARLGFGLASGHGLRRATTSRTLATPQVSAYVAT